LGGTGKGAGYLSQAESQATKPRGSFKLHPHLTGKLKEARAAKLTA